MVWSRLFKIKSIEEAMRPTLVDNYWRKAQLGGRNLAMIRKIFSYSKLPFIYDKRYVNKINNKISPYHKFPKSYSKHENYVLSRMSRMKIALANSKEREIKVRQDNLNKRKLGGFDKVMKDLMPMFIKPQKDIKIKDDDKKRSKKKVSDYLKGVPSGKVGTTKKNKEKIKNFMLDGHMKAEDLEAPPANKKVEVEKAKRL